MVLAPLTIERPTLRQAGHLGVVLYRPSMASDYFCPTDTPSGIGPDEAIIIGCGAIFTADLDDEGLIDCPRCGVWFDPAVESRDFGVAAGSKS